MANNLISALIIAVVQGLTEWLPISSSGHLVIAENFLNYAGGLFFDVALHFGTLMAVFVYFGKDIVNIIEDLLKGKWKSDNARLGWLVLLATIPAAIVGFLFRSLFEQVFSSIFVVTMGFAITGLVLLISSKDYGIRRKNVGIGGALVIGFAQIFALIPGISRSGMTISSGLLLGLKEKDSIKFSFLMSIPIIFGANILEIGNNALPSEMIWATLVSFVVGLLSIHLLYRYFLTKRENMKWFGIYCLALAALLTGILIF